MTDIEMTHKYEREDGSDERDHGNEEEIIETRSSFRKKLIKLGLFMLLVGFIIFVVIDSQRDQHLKNISQGFLQWVQQNPIAGIFSFVGVYFVATGRYIIILEAFCSLKVNCNQLKLDLTSGSLSRYSFVYSWINSYIG